MLIVFVIFSFVNMQVRAAGGGNLTAQRIIYYSPSSIGDDVINSEIDLYTLPYMFLHQMFLSDLRMNFGVTHIIVNNRWDACEDCHQDFLDLLKKLDIHLYISLVVPINGQIAKGTTSLLKLVVRELSDYTGVFDGFYVLLPEKLLSDNDWIYYYNYVNALPSLFAVTFKIVAEFPIDRSTMGIMTKSIRLETVRAAYWIVTIYADFPSYFEGVKFAVKTYLNTTVSNILPMIVSSSFNNMNRTEDGLLQDDNVNRAFKNLKSDKKFFDRVAGSAFYEFSDEWWTSAGTDAGFDIEGCPNSNPFAHTPCGYRVLDGLLNMEWLGLYSLQYMPFHSCLVAKPVAKTLQYYWSPNNTRGTYIPCATNLPMIISFLPYPLPICILAMPFICVALTIFVVICCSSDKKLKSPNEDDQNIQLST